MMNCRVLRLDAAFDGLARQPASVVGRTILSPPSPDSAHPSNPQTRRVAENAPYPQRRSSSLASKAVSSHRTLKFGILAL